jgi:DNA-binding NarL/FixJ family response regulator
MSQIINTYVYSDDPILKAGLISQMHQRAEIRIVDADNIAEGVAVVITEQVTDATVQVLKGMRCHSIPRIVLIANAFDEDTVIAAAEAGVCGLIRRNEATPAHVVATLLRVAAGDGAIPADLLGRLLLQLGRLQREVLSPRGLALAALSKRETDVLKLIADGRDTASVARQLAYSERTVKNILHDLNIRLQLRNRSHAVAYAVRQGFI